MRGGERGMRSRCLIELFVMVMVLSEMQHTILTVVSVCIFEYFQCLLRSQSKYIFLASIYHGLASNSMN